VTDPRVRHLVRYAGDFAPFTIARAEGAWVETTDGRRILDFTSGQICSTIGHNHPRITGAIRQARFRVRSVGSRPIVPTSHARSANPHR
jgi:2,2-dialkylglycine decarboxylase (pyruvate)